MQLSPAYFDAMFQHSDDPWKFRSRWYELRKRALTLACLPQPRYGSAYEPGCANGELSAALAGRCDRLLVSDGSPIATALACERLRGLAHVEVQQLWLPRQWPAEKFDLLVISEMGFYLNAQELDTMAQKARNALHPGGTVLACHWRRPIEDCELGGDEVQRRLGAGLNMPLLSSVVEPDFRLDVWCQDPRSVAQREGFA